MLLMSNSSHVGQARRSPKCSVRSRASKDAFVKSRTNYPPTTIFGRINDRPVFGMPGYPTSCLLNAHLAPRFYGCVNMHRSVYAGDVVSEYLLDSSERKEAVGSDQGIPGNWRSLGASVWGNKQRQQFDCRCSRPVLQTSQPRERKGG